MNRTKLLCAIGLLAGVWGSQLAVPEARGGEVFQVDPVHSAINFKVRHLFSFTSGRFPDFSGTLQYDADHPERSRMELVIQATSIDTDNEKRDAHLRASDFLEVDKHPLITFTSTRIRASEKPNVYQVEGDFTLRGVTHPLTVDVEILGFGDVPGFGTRGGFNAKAVVPRKDYGVVWNRMLDQGGTVLGDDVHVECSIEVFKQEGGAD